MAPVHQSNFPLYESLKAWQPFRLDALGLITLLGADEVARVCGSLTSNTLTDYLPLFGAFKIASNEIADVEPGFALYNISDGVWVTELSAWFTRWLWTNLESDYVLLKWDVKRGKMRRFGMWDFVGMALGAVINLGLITFTLVEGDWYGFANAVAMSLSVLVRAFIEHAYRRDIDEKIVNYCAKRPNGPSETHLAKFLIVLPDGRLAIYRADRGLIGLMLDSRSAVQPRKVWIARGLGWLAFGVQVIAVGQSFLPTQLATVVIMVAASLMTIFRIGAWRIDRVGNYLKLQQTPLRSFTKSKMSRQQTYAWLNPKEGKHGKQDRDDDQEEDSEEDYMYKRALLPDKMWKSWWKDWEALKKQRDEGWQTGQFDTELEWLGFETYSSGHIQQTFKAD